MAKELVGGTAQDWVSRPLSVLAKLVTPRPRGVILLAVLVFVALLLPLITLVLTSINTESVSTAEAVKGAKAELAAEKAINDAIALVVQQKAYPDYWTSIGQPNTAIIVRDPQTGARRDQIDTSAAGNIGAGVDDIYGTNDDYWMGPRGDRSHIGADDTTTAVRNYRYDFAFSQLNAPTYVGQSWSFSPENRAFGVSPFNGSTIWFFNQYGAVDSAFPTDNNADKSLDDGYDPANPSPFVDDEPTLKGPGYYPARDGGPERPIVTDLANAANKDTMLLDGSVESAMYNAKVNLFESVFSDLDSGPLPTSMLKSYADVTDEAGRLNLNMFCKKVKVFVPESADTDYDFSGVPSADFNANQVFDETGWKWMDNPLFPDRYRTNILTFDPTTDAFNNPGGSVTILDFGKIDPLSGQFSNITPLDGVAMPELGECIAHYYEGDTGPTNGIPESVESMRNSIRMLESLGLTPLQAAQLLTYLNPPLDAIQSGAYPDPNSDPWNPGIPGGKSYPTLNSLLNVTGDDAELPYNTASGAALSTDPAVAYPDRRIDACNITPPLIALKVDQSGTGAIDQYQWQMGFSEVDDLPLPQPHPLTNIDQLLDIPSFTEATVQQLRDKVTIFSYDTNLIASNVADVGPNADLVNAYLPGDPQYNGTSTREIPDEMRDTDNVPDLRFDVSRYVFGFAMTDYRQTAEEMYAYVREHLPRPLFDKITLPTVDRMGRADSADSMAPNTDPRYDLNNPGTLTKMLPHRDSAAHPYNVSGLGHELDNNGEPGAGYPALNPAFSLDSCLSIVMYRSGTSFEEDDYNFNPQGAAPDDAWRMSFSRISYGAFSAILRRLSGPFANLLAQLFGPGGSNPDPNAGFNKNPLIPAHGPALGVISLDPVSAVTNLVNPGALDTPADLLDVPLYKFGNLSVSMMADPPSDFRWDRNNNGTVNNGDPNETKPVNYYIGFSDVVDYGWYLQNVAPMGPDGRADSGDEPDESRVLYTVYFTRANRPVAPLGNINPAGMWDAVIPITAKQLKLMSAGTPDQGSKVALGFFPDPAYDPGSNTFIGGKPLIDSDYIDTVRHSAIWNSLPLASRPTGTLAPVFTWRDVPLPEEDGTAGAPTAHAGSRPSLGGDWPAGYLSSQYTLQGGITPWAYDEHGDPYLTARCEVVNNWKNPAGAATQQERADDVCNVYLQYNARAQVPFRVSILPVRISGSEFEIRSAFGGAQTLNGSYLLYDWNISGTASSYDGTWPEPQTNQTGDPRVIRVTPNDASGTASVSLRLYDLRAFVDASGLPLGSGNPPLNGNIWQNGEVFGQNTFSAGGGTFPQSYNPPPGDPLPNDPSETDPGYATDAASVASINAGAVVRAQISAIKPSVYRDDPDVPVRVAGVGGQLNYTYRLRVLSSQLGDPTSAGATQYPGPDGNAYGTGDSWPLNAANQLVTYPWESTGAMPRHSELSGFTWDALAFPGYIANNHYDASQPASVLDAVTLTSDQPDLTHSFNFTGFNDAWYWVEVALWDSDNAGGQTPGNDGLVAADAYAYTKVTVSNDREPGGSTGTPPEVNASIWLSALNAGPDGTRQLGFNCGVSVDGGNGGYNYFWDVTRPVYSANPNVLDGLEIPVIGLQNRVMTSNLANPQFVFDPSPANYGVYFINCYVMDHASSPPQTVNATVAHDVAMVTVNNTGVTLSDFTSTDASVIARINDSLSRTPMAVLAARSPGPGNANTAIGTNDSGTSGTNRPFLGSTMLLPDKPVVEPDMAAAGQTIVIRGYNFDPVPARNTVHFAGGVDAIPFMVRIVPAAEAAQYDPPGPGGPFDQMELSVQVPQNAQPGNISVKTSTGVSERVFFQTGYRVTFDLIGSLSVNDPTMLNFEVDYQGDGFIDYQEQMVVDGGTPGILNGADKSIVHDYAADGVGNYDATLIVSDLISGRKQVSHQLITIKDRRPTTGFLTITSGTVTGIAGAPPAVTLTDNTASFLSMGTVDPTWSIYNTNTASANYGRATSVIAALSNDDITIGAAFFAIGDTYEIRKNLANPTNNGMLNNIWPTVEMRSDTFTAQSGQGMTFNSAVGGVSSSGLKYKWALNLNDVTAATPDTPQDRIDFTVSAAVNGGGIPTWMVLTTNTNWTYVNLPSLPFNVLNDSDGGAVWRVTAIPGNNVPGFGVLGQNQLRVEYISGGTGPYNWVAGEQGHLGQGAANSGRNRVTTGLVSDVFGGANNPDYGRLDNILIDVDNNFRQAGPRGVTVGDVAFNDTDGSTGTIYSIDSNTQLRMDNAVDTTHVLGLLNGGPIGRAGTLTGRSPDLAPGAPFQAIFDITQAGYVWHGHGALPNEGGFIVGDGDPAVFVDENGLPLPYAADSLFWNITDHTAWRVIGINVPPVPNDNTMRVQFMNPLPPGPPGIPIGPTDGWRTFDITVSTPLGGTPPVFVLDTSIDWTTLNLPPEPFDIFNAGDANANWRVTALPGEDVPTFGVLGNNQIRVEYVLGGTLPYDWPVGDQGIIVLNAQWAIGDDWQGQFPRNQWRANYNYSIASHSGGMISDEPQGNVWADCAFADTGAPVDFYVTISAAYGMALPAAVEFDWDNNAATPNDTVMAKVVANGSSGSQYIVKATHMFSALELTADPMVNGHGEPTQAIYRMSTTASGQNSAYQSPWARLPIVIVGGDHFDNSLRTLNLDWNSSGGTKTHAWDNSKWNHVTLETCFSISYNMLDNSAPGLNNTVRRWYFAGDQLLLPPGMDNYGDTLTTWASYSKPFVYSNNIGVTAMRHQAVHGLGSALNWMSDANADTRWRNASNSNESPLANNPVNYHEFVFQNGTNTMNVPNASNRGASFPRQLPGVGRADVSGGFIFYTANKGTYNGLGFVSDNLPQAERAFSGDTQPIFWGDRVNASSTATRETKADFYINPLVGSNTQLYQLVSAVTSGGDTDNYSYFWTVTRRPVGGHTVYTWTNTGPNPLFNPAQAAPAGDAGDGVYDVYLSIGSLVFSPKRTFEVRLLPLQAYLMANPPSGTVDSTIEFPIFVEGGRPGYSLQIDFGDGNNATKTLNDGYEATFSHRYADSGNYTVILTVTDAAGTVVSGTNLATPELKEIVNIADVIPLNVTMAVAPPSGVAPFMAAVYYSVSGGSPISTNGGEGYNVVISLVNNSGRVEQTVTRTKANTFSTGIDKLNTILDGPKADPVLLTIPAPGNYSVEVQAMDDGSGFAEDSEDVFASGYLVVGQYGNGAPQVVRDMENRPMHAVRVWRDPFLSRGLTSTNEDYRNIPDTSTLTGGRLMEGDLQVLGDILTTDPNQNFRSVGMNATKDPLEQPLYYADYTLSASGQQVQDYYDTFTEGRVNINTASEDVLTALFRKCIKQRSYSFNSTVLGQPVRAMRNPSGDAYVTEDEARTMAREVVKYRAAYYDQHKPDVSNAGSDFGYVQSANTGNGDLGNAFRVDHLPVIGPWDGANPHEYDVNTRDAQLQNADDPVNNAWDHMAASYYNFDSSSNRYMFYAPTDIAFVRSPWTANLSLNDLTTGQNFSLTFREPAGDYAKYMNDTVTNGLWSDDRGPLFAAWAATNLYNSGNTAYSRWAYDARNYFSYSGGQIDVSIQFNPAGPPAISFSPVAGTQEDVTVARNRMGIIQSNGETAYTYISNPPFRNLFDLFNVIDGSEQPNTWRLIANGGGTTYSMDMPSPNPVLANSTFVNVNNLMENAQIFSGPSVFRYAAQWDNQNCQFITMANYLDDIAPYITCRSYTFRVEASGVVEPSGGASTAESGGSTTSRDRGVSAVIDVGPLWAHRRLSGSPAAGFGTEPQPADVGSSYSVLWRQDKGAPYKGNK